MKANRTLIVIVGLLLSQFAKSQDAPVFLDGTEPAFAKEVLENLYSYAECAYQDSTFLLSLKSNVIPRKGMKILFTACETNSGPVKIRIGDFGPYDMVLFGFLPLERGQILKGQVVQAIFDGRAFQMMNTPAPDFLNPNQPKIVFVSSQSYSANLGGIEGADNICAELAFEAGLDGEWVALIGTSEVNPKDRIQLPGVYTNTRGSKVSDNSFIDAWDEQFPYAIYRSVRYDEFGREVDPANPSAGLEVWTGSDLNGITAKDDCGNPATCADWTLSTALDICNCEQGEEPCAIVGDPFSNQSNWINQRTAGCGEEKHLYCIQR